MLSISGYLRMFGVSHGGARLDAYYFITVDVEGNHHIAACYLRVIPLEYAALVLGIACSCSCQQRNVSTCLKIRFSSSSPSQYLLQVLTRQMHLFPTANLAWWSCSFLYLFYSF